MTKGPMFINCDKCGITVGSNEVYFVRRAGRDLDICIECWDKTDLPKITYGV